MRLIYFITDVDLNGGAGPVLSIAGAPAPGASLQTAPNTSLPSQLWQFTSEGQIVSTYDSTLALSIGPNNTLIVDTLQADNEAQLWKFAGGPNDLGPIASQQTGQVLTVYSPNSPTDSAVVLEPAQNTQAQQWTGMSQGCDSLLTTVTNGTANALTLTATATEGTTNLSGSIPLPPNTSVTILSSYDGGLATSFSVWDPNYSSTNSVASFAVHQHRCGIVSAGEVWVDTINYVDGYIVADVQTQKGSSSDSLPGNVSVSINN